MARADRHALLLADRASFDAAARRARIVRLALAVLAADGDRRRLPGRAAHARTKVPARRHDGHRRARCLLERQAEHVLPDRADTRHDRGDAEPARARALLGRGVRGIPLGDSAAELKPLLRFFAPPTNKVDQADAQNARTPWDQWFSAGTKISNGLLLALRMLDEQHAKRAAVMLISDLADDPTDLTRLTDAVLAFQDRKIPLEIVALDPTPANADFFRRLLGDEAIFQEAKLPTGAQARGQLELTGTFPTALAGFGVLSHRVADRERLVGSAAAVGTGGDMIRRLAAAGVMLVAAVFLVLLAHDVWHSEHAMTDADFRASIGPVSSARGTRTRVCPTGLRGVCLGLDDDIEYRATTMRGLAFASKEVDPKTLKERAIVEAALQRIAADTSDPERASLSADLLGVLRYTDPRLPDQVESAYEGDQSTPTTQLTPEQKAMASSLWPCGSIRATRTRSETSSCCCDNRSRPLPKGVPQAGGGDRAGRKGSGAQDPGHGY